MNEPQLPDMSMNTDELYRETSITDQKAGNIRIMTPIKSDGSDDAERKTIYLGQTQLMTPGGALPLTFELEADSLEDAVKQFGDAAKAAFERTMEELKELRRQSASSIVVPGAENPMGGGKIQMP